MTVALVAWACTSQQLAAQEQLTPEQLASIPTVAEMRSWPYSIGMISLTKQIIAGLPAGDLLFPAVTQPSKLSTFEAIGAPLTARTLKTVLEDCDEDATDADADADPEDDGKARKCSPAYEAAVRETQQRIDSRVNQAGLLSLSKMLTSIETSANNVRPPESTKLQRMRGAIHLELAKDGALHADCRLGTISVPQELLRQVLNIARGDARNAGFSDDLDKTANRWLAITDYPLRNLPDVPYPVFGTVALANEYSALSAAKRATVPKDVKETVEYLVDDGNSRLTFAANLRKPKLDPNMSGPVDPDDWPGRKAFEEIADEEKAQILEWLAAGGSARAAELKRTAKVFRTLARIEDGDAARPPLTKAEQAIDDSAKNYAELVGKFQMRAIGASLSATRALLFLLAHEMYHVRFNQCEQTLENETHADMYAVAVYTEFFKTMSLPRMSAGSSGLFLAGRSDTGGGNNPMQTLSVQSVDDYLRNASLDSEELESAVKQLEGNDEDADFLRFLGTHAMKTLLVLYARKQMPDVDPVHAPMETRMKAAMIAFSRGRDAFYEALWGELDKTVKKEPVKAAGGD
jgi:hypothetical protein